VRHAAKRASRHRIHQLWGSTALRAACPLRLAIAARPPYAPLLSVCADYFLSLEPTGPNAAAYLFNARTLGCGTSVPEAITEDSFWAVNATAQVATLTLAGRGTSSRWWTAGSPVYCQPSGIVGEAYQLTVEAVPWPSATSTPSPSPSTSPSATASATLSPSCTPLAGSISSLHMGVNGTVQQSLSTGSHSFFALDATSSGECPLAAENSACTPL